MELYDALLNIFTDNSTRAEFEQDCEGFLNQNGLGNVTSQDIQAEMPRVLEAASGNTGGAAQGGLASFAGSGNVTLPPPPAPSSEAVATGGAGGGLQGAIESINHYTNVVNNTEQSFQDNDTTTIDDRDTTVDSSVNQNIEAFGDVNQDFDNDVVSGDGAVAAGDDAQVNTGDGEGDTTLNQGEGDLTQIEDSTLSESVVGDGTAQSNDVAIDADDGSSVAFGDGASSTAETQDVDIANESGTVQVADDATQTAATDNSVDASTEVDAGTEITDSYNADLDYTDNSVDTSTETSDSFNDQSDNSVDTAIEDNDTTAIDNDALDVM